MRERRSDEEGAGEEDEDENDEVECCGRGVVAGGRRGGGWRKGGRVQLTVRVRVRALVVEATGFEEGMRGGGGHGRDGGDGVVDHVKGSRQRGRAADARFRLFFCLRMLSFFF